MKDNNRIPRLRWVETLDEFFNGSEQLRAKVQAVRQYKAQQYKAEYETSHKEGRRKWRAGSQYDAKREGSRSGLRFGQMPRKGGPFIAVDSEGLNVGQPFKAKIGKDGALMQDQRTCLWMAGGVEGVENESIVNVEGLRSEDIFEFLTSVPMLFYNKISDKIGKPLKKQPIFISFGFGYDVAQIIKDFPYEKGWEVWNGKPYSERKNPNYPSNYRGYPVLWKGYAIYSIPMKMVVLFKLRNPDKPFKRTGPDQSIRNLDYIENSRICIYDAFGFFQQSFVGAIKDMPGVVADDEFARIAANKKKRGFFKGSDIEELKRYTADELKALVNMLSILRSSLREAIPGRPIELREWYGAGAIANALLGSYLGKDARKHLGNIEEDSEPRRWALRAYFGARIDLGKQGSHVGPLYEYDVSSAYPAKAADLPSMAGGRWEKIVNPTREQVEKASPLSMFEVKTHGYARDLPFYALPFRMQNGAILFPCAVWGVYMRDHVVAAFKHFDKFQADNRLCDYSLHPQGASIELIAAWIFYPASDEKPLAWIRQCFNYRASLPKKDARGQVIKLGINSIYGKFAQRIGRAGKPPKFASPWYAAAITAGTQRQLIEAALTKPDAIVAFATDGIYSVEPLDVSVPAEKTLGEWEMQKGSQGAFIQSGVYSVHLDDKNGSVEKKVKSRGFSPQNIRTAEDWKDALDRTLSEDIPNMWANGVEDYPFDYLQYMTIGECAVSRKSWPYIGMWKRSPRRLQLNRMSNKRIVPNEKTKKAQKLRQQRARALIPLPVRHLPFPYVELSAESVPEWLSEQNKLERHRDEDVDNIAAGLS